MRRLFLTVLVLSGCGGGPPTFSRVQSEVFNKSCLFAGCHSGSAAAGSLNLDGPAFAKMVNVKAKGDPAVTDLTLVVPGDPTASYLYQKLSQPKPKAGAQMPNNGDPLDSARLQLVRDWIAAGAPND